MKLMPEATATAARYQPLAGDCNSTLVRADQIASGRDPCFRTERRWSCASRDCRWRGECLRLVADWRC